MPYRRRYNRRRKRRGCPKPKAYTYGGMATKVAKDVMYLKSLLNIEYFSIGTAFTVDPNSSGAVLNLSAIAQGDDNNSRQGNKIRAKNLLCSGVITLHASATDSRVRLVIVRDNNGSTSQPAISDLWSTVASFFNNRPKLGTPQSNSRFSILMDKMVIVNSDTPTKSFNWSQSLDHHVYFTGTGATDEGKGHCYLMIASNEATNDPVVNATSRFYYIDN